MGNYRYFNKYFKYLKVRNNYFKKGNEVYMIQSNNIAIIFANTNLEYTQQMLDKTIKKLSEVEKNSVQIYKVPGCFEIPIAIEMINDKKEYDVYCVIGAFATFGEEIYMEMIKNTQRDIQKISSEIKIPIINGVVVSETKEKLKIFSEMYSDKLAENIIQMNQFIDAVNKEEKF